MPSSSTTERIPGAGPPGARVQNRRHLDPGPRDVGRRRVRGVVVGEHHRAGRGAHRVPVGIGLRGRREHHPRSIVVGEDDRALVGSGREHHLAGPHHPQPRARISREALRHRDQILIVVAECGRSGEHRHPGILPELGLHLFDPFDERPPAGKAALPEQSSTEPRSIFDEKGAGTRTGRGKAGRETGRSPPHHKHVAEVVCLVVAIGIGGDRTASKPGRTPDEPLVEEPARGRPHERLVVEPGWKESRSEARRRSEIEGERRPPVLASGDHARLDLYLGRPQIGFCAGAFPDRDERVRFLRPRPPSLRGDGGT